MQDWKGIQLADEDANLALFIAAYDDPAAATADFKSLKDAQDADEFKIVASAVVSRDDDGKVTVKETGTGQTGAGAWIGGGADQYDRSVLLGRVRSAGVGRGRDIVHRHGC